MASKTILTKGYFKKNGFVELENNSFEKQFYKNQVHHTIVILWNGENWYFPKNDTENHIFKYEEDVFKFF